MKGKIVVLLLAASMFFWVSCKKYDGVNSARLDSVTILSTSNGDNLIQRGESSVRISLKGLWDKSKLSYGDIHVSGPIYNSLSSQLSSAEVFTTNEIIINLNFSYISTAGTYEIYVCDGDSEMWYDSNRKSITVY